MLNNNMNKKKNLSYYIHRAGTNITYLLWYTIRFSLQSRRFWTYMYLDKSRQWEPTIRYLS